MNDRRGLLLGAAALVLAVAAVVVAIVSITRKDSDHAAKSQSAAGLGASSATSAVAAGTGGPLGTVTIDGPTLHASFPFRGYSWGATNTCGLHASSVGNPCKVIRKPFVFRRSVTTPGDADYIHMVAAATTNKPISRARVSLNLPGKSVAQLTFSNGGFASDQVTAGDNNPALEEASIAYRDVVADFGKANMEKLPPGRRLVGSLALPGGPSSGFDVTNFSWGYDIPRDATTALATGRTHVRSLQLTTPVDDTVGFLLNLALRGSHIPTATVGLLGPANGSTPYLTYKLTDVVITSWTIGAAAGEAPVIQLSLDFDRIQMTSATSLAELTDLAKQ